MTNEEKIFELSLKYFPYVNPTIDSPIKQALLEMAAWKKQQMIEKACKWIKIKVCPNNKELQNIFVKDFKKVMMEE